MFPLRPTTPTAPELSGHLNCLIINFNYLNQKEITVLRNICGRPYRDVSFTFAPFRATFSQLSSKNF